MNSHVTVGLSRSRLKWVLWLALCSVWLSGCDRQDAPRLPPPVYQEPSLPYWEPPPAEDVAPFDLEGMEGETVEDDEEDLDEGQASEPTPQTPLPEGKAGQQTESDVASEADSNSGAKGEADSTSGAKNKGEADSNSGAPNKGEAPNKREDRAE